MDTESKMKRQGLISIVVPAFNEAGNLAALVDAIEKSMKAFKYEIILVNDGSSDDSLELMKAMSKAKPEIRYISFSRNFGHQAALRAGISRANGECVISMDADMQHPPKLIPKLIEKWRDSYDIVYTRRKKTASDGLIKRVTSAGYYKVLRYLSGLDIEEGAADFRLIDRTVADVINSMQEQNLFMRGFINWCGFQSYAIDYVPDERLSGVSKYSFRKMTSLAIQGITQFSIKPLRFASLAGFICAGAGIVYGIYAIWLHLATQQTLEGWTSVIISVLIMGGVQLVVLGIIGEYLGRTFIQTKNRPDFIVKEEG